MSKLKSTRQQTIRHVNKKRHERILIKNGHMSCSVEILCFRVILAESATCPPKPRRRWRAGIQRVFYRLTKLDPGYFPDKAHGKFRDDRK